MATARIESAFSIELLVEMSIGTDRGTWWADPEFGSTLWILRRYGKVGPTTAGEVKRIIEAAVAWLVLDDLAKQIEVVTEHVGRNAIAWAVTVTRPGGGTALVKDVWNGIAAT
jgi:phage gp46-like protein